MTAVTFPDEITMKSGKQRKAELKAKRAARAKKLAAIKKAETVADKMRHGVAVNVENLAPSTSYRLVELVRRGYYEPVELKCETCGIDQVWTPQQQKWWYEVAKGNIYSTAKLCRPCRRRRNEERRKQAEGLAHNRAENSLNG